jgi:hypothetical protein
MYKFELTNTTIVTRGGKTQNYYLCRVLEKPDETCKGYRFIESKLFNKELFTLNEALEGFAKFIKKYGNDERTSDRQRMIKKND